MTGRAGTRGAYAYDHQIDFSFASVRADTPVTAGPDGYVVTLFNGRVPGGLVADSNFFSLYEGSITIDVDTADTYHFIFEVTHEFDGGAPPIVSARRYSLRVGRQSVETVPLNVFNSVTRLAAGQYDELLAQESTMTFTLRIVRDNEAAYNIEGLDGQRLAGTFFQLREDPKGAASLKERIENALRAANRWTVTEWSEPRLAGIAGSAPTPAVAVRWGGTATVGDRRRQLVEVLAIVASQRSEKYWAGEGLESIERMLVEDVYAAEDAYPELLDATIDYGMDLGAGPRVESDRRTNRGYIVVRVPVVGP
ncbi:MAG: hypothetical protein F4103_04880 [Boseongicola sp. SB0673_bin_14]|nr:hypothetical protein [Boseongicola sp. SB0673_bin_14]